MTFPLFIYSLFLLLFERFSNRFIKFHVYRVVHDVAYIVLLFNSLLFILNSFSLRYINFVCINVCLLCKPLIITFAHVIVHFYTYLYFEAEVKKKIPCTFFKIKLKVRNV